MPCRQFLNDLDFGGLSGSQTVWHENGHKKGEVTCNNGKFEGIVTKWYENGHKEYEEILATRRVGLNFL